MIASATLLIARIIFFAVVARRGFSAKQEDARYAVGLRVFADLFILRQNIQQVEVLAFVFVQALNLDIKIACGLMSIPVRRFTNSARRTLFACLMSR